MINLVSFFTSLYAGFAVFSIIGYMANEYGIGVDEVINSGEYTPGFEIKKIIYKCTKIIIAENTIDGLFQGCSNPNANALVLPQFCIDP